MAKTIKFNLICDEKSVRTIEDLRENFSVEDILAYFENGLLCKWLSVRGYAQELEQVEQIKETDDLAVAKALVKIFDIEADEDIIEQNIYALTYQKERMKRIEQYDAHKYKTDQIVKDYYAGYEKLIKRILYHNYEMDVIKAAIKEIAENYEELFAIDYLMLFELFYELAPMAIYVMLTHQTMRSKYLDFEQEETAKGALSVLDDYCVDETIDVDTDHANAVYTWKDQQEKGIRLLLSKLTEIEKMQEVLDDHLKSYVVKEKYDFWRRIEEPGKKYLILNMAEGNRVMAATEFNADFGAAEIKGKFVILDGIQYQSNDTVNRLYYMEV